MNNLEILLNTLKACENQAVKVSNLELLLDCNNATLRSLVSNLRSLGYCIIHSKVEKSYKLITDKKTIADYCVNEIEKHLSIIKWYQGMLRNSNGWNQRLNLNLDIDLLMAKLNQMRDDFDSKTIDKIEDLLLGME